jgi:hypothetical protein
MSFILADVSRIAGKVAYSKTKRDYTADVNTFIRPTVG